MNQSLRRLVLAAAAIALVATLLVPAGLALAQQSNTYKLGCFSMTVGSDTQRQSASYRLRDLTNIVSVDGGGSVSQNYRMQPGAIQSRFIVSPPPGPGPIAPAPDPNGFKMPVIFNQQLVLRFACN